MAANKSYTIHKSKKSLTDRDFEAGENLKRTLESMEHRNELVADFKDISFINDARSIDLLSTRDTFKCILKPIIWLSASTPHDRDFALIEKYVKYKVKAIVVYGFASEGMKTKLGHLVEWFSWEKEITEAVRTGFTKAEPGDCIVFSPGCLPDDGYAGYEQRGIAFRNAIAKTIEV